VPEAWEANASPVGPRVDGVFTVTRTGSLTAALTVFYQISGSAQNGIDYNTLSGSVVIPVNSASFPINVVPIDDTLFELPEKVILTVTCNGTAYAVGIPGSAIVKIQDRDDPQPIFGWANAKILELGVPLGIDYNTNRNSIVISMANSGPGNTFFEIQREQTLPSRAGLGWLIFWTKRN
jgi:Calx-beta domain